MAEQQQKFRQSAVVLQPVESLASDGSSKLSSAPSTQLGDARECRVAGFGTQLASPGMCATDVAIAVAEGHL